MRQCLSSSLNYTTYYAVILVSLETASLVYSFLFYFISTHAPSVNYAQFSFFFSFLYLTSGSHSFPSSSSSSSLLLSFFFFFFFFVFPSFSVCFFLLFFLLFFSFPYCAFLFLLLPLLHFIIKSKDFHSDGLPFFISSFRFRPSLSLSPSSL